MKMNSTLHPKPSCQTAKHYITIASAQNNINTNCSRINHLSTDPQSSQSRPSSRHRRGANQPTAFQVISDGTGRAHACEAGLIRESDAHLDGLPVVGVHPLPSDEPLRPEQPRGEDLLHRGARVRAHLHTQNISNPQPTSERRHRTVTQRREGEGCGMKRRRGRWRVDKVRGGSRTWRRGTTREEAAAAAGMWRAPSATARRIVIIAIAV